jgi:hypothetical protein
LSQNHTWIVVHYFTWTIFSVPDVFRIFASLHNTPQGKEYRISKLNSQPDKAQSLGIGRNRDILISILDIF